MGEAAISAPLQAVRQSGSCHWGRGMLRGHAGNWDGCAGGASQGSTLTPCRAS